MRPQLRADGDKIEPEAGSREDVFRPRCDDFVQPAKGLAGSKQRFERRAAGVRYLPGARLPPGWEGRDKAAPQGGEPGLIEGLKGQNRRAMFMICSYRFRMLGAESNIPML